MANPNKTTETEQYILNRVKHADIDALDVIPYTLSTDGLTATPVSTSAPIPIKVIDSDGTDNSLSTGGQIGQKQMIVGTIDLPVRGIAAEGASLSQIQPHYGGFKDGSGNSYGMTGDVNGLDVDVTRLPALVAGSAVIGKVSIDQTTPETTNGVQVLNSLVPEQYDYISLGYTGANLTTAVYKTGGSGGTTVATLTLAYTGSVLDSVTKT